MRRRGTSVTDFFARFPDEDACLAHIFKVRWGDHSPCPKCGQLGRWSPVRGRKNYQHACREQVSILGGTIFYRSNLSLMAWFYAMLLLCNASVGVRGSFIRRQLGLGLRSSVRLVNMIRLQMAAFDRPEQIGGPGKTVYVDEAKIRYGPAAASGGSDFIIMGLACEDAILSGVIPDRKGSTLLYAIDKMVRPGSRIITDSHNSYFGLSGRGWDHVRVNHAVAFHDFEGNDTNRIETYWRVLKRTLSGYRMMTPDNLWLYLAEVEFRYAHRRSEASNFDILISGFSAGGTNIDRLRRRFDWRPE